MSSKLTLTITANEAPQTYHAVSCIACGGTHLVDPATGELLVPRPKARVAQFMKRRAEAVSGRSRFDFFLLPRFASGAVKKES